ncbi:MAG: Flagellar basal body rod protein FlgB [Syntrophomonadaceae bacterium]|nr:Flagellar basal body rod protein FlgB [Bacillota bacterium]
MFTELWSDHAFLALHKGLDAAAKRQRVTSHNLANLNTPNFKRSEVSFEAQLRNSLAGSGRLTLEVTHPRHIGRQAAVDEVRPRVLRDNSTTMRADGNNVDVDREMAALASNQLMYNAMAQLVNEKYGLLRYVIHEGRR